MIHLFCSSRQFCSHCSAIVTVYSPSKHHLQKIVALVCLVRAPPTKYQLFAWRVERRWTVFGIVNSALLWDCVRRRSYRDHLHKRNRSDRRRRRCGCYTWEKVCEKEKFKVRSNACSEHGIILVRLATAMSKQLANNQVNDQTDESVELNWME